MRFFPYAAALCLMPLAATAADDAAIGRYSIAPAPQGYVRLDTETGAILHCRETEGAIRCEDVDTGTTEARAAKPELKILRNRVEALERRVADLERDPIRLPTERELDQTLDMMESWMRRFMDMAEDRDTAL